jgi:hypothetical protein
MLFSVAAIPNTGSMDLKFFLEEFVKAYKRKAPPSIPKQA